MAWSVADYGGQIAEKRVDDLVGNAIRELRGSALARRHVTQTPHQVCWASAALLVEKNLHNTDFFDS